MPNKVLQSANKTQYGTSSALYAQGCGTNPTFKILSVLGLLIFAGCPGSPVATSMMSPEQLQSVPADQLRWAYFNNRSDKLTNEVRRRAESRCDSACSIYEFHDILADYGYISDVETAINRSRRKWFVDKNPELPLEVKEAILQGRITFGMDKIQVVASWGKPNDVNKTVTPYSTHEQWVYSDYSYILRCFEPYAYVYFENGILTSWQD